MMARISKAAALAAAALTLLAAPVDRAAAQGVPVYDASSVAQLIEQVANQLDQLATMQAQLESLTGARGLGAFMNSPEDIAARAAAENLSGLVDGAITGSPKSPSSTRDLKPSRGRAAAMKRFTTSGSVRTSIGTITTPAIQAP